MTNLAGPMLSFQGLGLSLCTIGTASSSQTMEAHANDFLPLLKSAVQDGRSCVTMVVDNGPDMNPTNYVNEYNLGKLWVDSKADLLVVTSYTAGQLAYNMIEHIWSPLSN